MPLQHQKLHRGLVQRDLVTSNGVIMSVVYVTAKPTFTGVIGGYSTLTYDDSNTTGGSDQTASAKYTVAPNSVIGASTSQQTSIAASVSSSHALSQSTGSVVNSTPTFASNMYSTMSDSYSTSSASQAATTDSASTSSADGMSVGAKLGIALGIIFAIGIFTLLPLIILARKRRQQKYQEQPTNEKKEPTSKPAAPAGDQSSPEVPRLSLRPVSSLVPEFMGGAKSKNRSSRDLLTPISETSRSGQTPSPAIALVERPRTGDNPFRDPENPFADPEKAAAGFSTTGRNLQANPASAPPRKPVNAPVPAMMTTEFSNPQQSSAPTADSFPMPQAQAHARSASSDAPETAPSNSPSQASVNEISGAAAPVIAQGPGGDAPQSSVYRILMDFRPTMDDELELRAGQLVRLLHEYDDGWALCIRMDRSQQGVVPRTCLAAKPSKPRPGPPPAGPNSRPMTPQGQSRGPGPRPQGPNYGNSRPQGPGSIRSQSPAAGRAQSPAMMTSDTGAFNQTPRPLSPGPRPQPQGRSMSPGPYGANGPKSMAPQSKRRSNSVGNTNARNKLNSPPGPSKLGPGHMMGPDSPGLAM